MVGDLGEPRLWTAGLDSDRKGTPMPADAAAHRNVAYRTDPTSAELLRLQKSLTGKQPVREEGRLTWVAPCPRCRWPLKIQIERIFMLDERTPRPPAECVCPRTHKGRPKDDQHGCGFLAHVPITAGT